MLDCVRMFETETNYPIDCDKKPESGKTYTVECLIRPN